jgi:adenylate cyclase
MNNQPKQKFMPKSLRRFLWEWRGVFITAPTVAGLVILLRWVGLFQSWEWAAFDQYLRLRPLEPPDDRIVLVGIDEADIKEIGKAMIPDGVYARLLQKLKARQPRAIGLDVYRDLPVEPGHQQLVQVFESTPNLVGIQKVVGDIRREAVAAPPALKAKGQVGANDVILDADSKLRRSLLYVQTPAGETVFSFGLYTALLYLEAAGIKPEIVEGTKTWRLGKTTFARFQPNDGGYVRADADGYQMLLNYRGPAKHFSTVSMTDILNDRVSADWGRDRIILIGYVGESFQDFHLTPYSSGLLSLPERMAGVEVHANIASQIISAALDGRPLIKSWAEPLETLWILLWSFVGATLSWKWRYTGGERVLAFQLGAIAVLAGTMLGSTFVAFLLSWWIPVVPAFLAMTGSAIAVTGYIAHTADQLRKTFGRYLSDSIVTNLLESPEGLKLGGESRTITILTSDLRGFTALSERLQPQEVVKLLNVYLEVMAEVITQYEGTIDEFMGDGILVLFGAPTVKEDDPVRAVACAIAMQLAMSDVNEKMQQLGFPKLEMGIAINTGEVVVGNIGSEKRTKYSVIGSDVNLTFRIESYTLGGQVLISESTLKEVESIVRIDGQKEVKPKGVQHPLSIYDIGGIAGKYNLFIPQQEEEFLPLPEKIRLQFHYALLDGKHIGNSLFTGSLVKLSSKGAEVHSANGERQSVPEPLSNIKLNLLMPDNPTEVSGDIYAKVLEKPTDRGNFFINFTSLPPDIEAMFENLYKSCTSES